MPDIVQIYSPRDQEAGPCAFVSAAVGLCLSPPLRVAYLEITVYVSTHGLVHEREEKGSLCEYVELSVSSSVRLAFALANSRG